LLRANIWLDAGRLHWRGRSSQPVKQGWRRRAWWQHKLPFEAAAGKAQSQACGSDSGH